MPKRPRLRIEQRSEPYSEHERKSLQDPETRLGGIYDHDNESFKSAQARGETRSSLEPEPPAYKEDTRREAPQKQEEKRFIKMTFDNKGKRDVVHNQREELLLNPKGLTHDLIHLAVTNVLKQPGFVHAAMEKLRDQHPGEISEALDQWPESARVEETIVDALEAAGIREGKIRENFWDALEAIADEQGVPVPEVSGAMLGAIADEIEALTTKTMGDEPHEYPIP